MTNILKRNVDDEQHFQKPPKIQFADLDISESLKKKGEKQPDGELKLILPYPPSVNNLYATFHGRRIISAQGRKFKSDIAILAKRQGAKILSGDLMITFRVFRPRKTGDLDNRLKISQDALKGICFEDDKQIIEIHAFRFDDKTNPRIEIDLKQIAETIEI